MSKLAAQIAAEIASSKSELRVVRVVIHKGSIKDFSRIYYSDGTALLGSVEDAWKMAERYNLLVESA